MLATIAADGHIADSEIDGFNSAVARLKIYQQMNGQDFRRMIDKLFGLLNRSNPQELLKMSAQTVPAELRDTTFAICLDLVLADGHLDREEELVIEALQASLGISDDFATKALQVLMVKNRG
jgi:uncharacterized tellurite resistance protein B-like protein